MEDIGDIYRMISGEVTAGELSRFSGAKTSAATRLSG